MGNCLVLEEKVVRIMKTDGKILEYKQPLQVHQVLAEFSGHAVSDSLPVLRHLQPETKLHSGCLYYLLPPPLPSTQITRKKVKFADPKVADEPGKGAVRIKVVMTKQELKEMLTREGVSVDDMIDHLQNKPSTVEAGSDENCQNERYSGWKPALQSIPEGTGFD